MPQGGTTKNQVGSTRRNKQIIGFYRSTSTLGQKRFLFSFRFFVCQLKPKLRSIIVLGNLAIRTKHRNEHLCIWVYIFWYAKITWMFLKKCKMNKINPTNCDSLFGYFCFPTTTLPFVVFASLSLFVTSIWNLKIVNPETLSVPECIIHEVHPGVPPSSEVFFSSKYSRFL